MASGEKTVYKYNSATYTLTLRFHDNNDSTVSRTAHNSKTSNAASVSVSCTIPETVPTKTGHTFLGYATSNGGSVSKQPGGTVTASFSRTTTGIASERTYESGVYLIHEITYSCSNKASGKDYYPVWEANKYTVSYNANGGSGAPASQTKTYGVSLTLSSTVPTRTNYVFKGWATSATGAVAYAAGASYTANAAVTLYAVWAMAGGTLTSVPGVTIGSGGTGSGTATATWTKVSDSHTYKLVMSLTGATSVSYTGIAAGSTSKSFTITTAWLSAIATSTTATATATLCTYANATQTDANLVGTSTKTFTVTVHADIKPSITSFTHAPASANTTVNGWNTYTQGYSYANLSVKWNAGTGATRKSVRFTGPNSYNQTVVGTAQTVNGTSEVLTASGSNSFTVTVTDSRGRTATSTVTATVYPYALPVVSSIKTMRAEADGTTANSTGLYLKVKPTYSKSSVNSKNSWTSQTLSYKLSGSSTVIQSKTCASGTTYGPTGTMWAIELGKAYDVTVSVTDSLGKSASLTVTLPPATGIWYGEGNDRLGLGVPPSGAGLYCDWNATFKGTVDRTNRRAYKSLSAAGWYRVLKYAVTLSSNATGAQGTVIEFNIQRGSSAENHSIELRCTSGSGIIFTNERSKSNTQYIDKIRYTYNTTSYNAFVDIHFTGTSAYNTGVEFDVHCYASGTQSIVTSQNLTAVSDSPSGETVVTTYTFQATVGLKTQAIQATSVTASGNVKGATMTSTGALTAASVTASGNVTGAAFYIGSNKLKLTDLGEHVNVAAGMTQTYALANGTRHMFVLIGASTDNQQILLVGVTSTGTVTQTKLGTADHITVTTSTNTYKIKSTTYSTDIYHFQLL